MDENDPRRAETLGEAAMNPDGTYNALRALSWLSSVTSKGAGLSFDDVTKIAEQVRRDKVMRK